MLYGHKETIDNQITLIVSSATSSTEYKTFNELSASQSTALRNYSAESMSEPYSHMVDPMFKGYTEEVHIFNFTSEAQRDLFVEEWSIEVVADGIRGRDKQEDMFYNDEREQEDEAFKESMRQRQAAIEAGVPFKGGKTIAEQYGLEENDPWDKRSDEEKEADRISRNMVGNSNDQRDVMGESFFSPDDAADMEATSFDTNGGSDISDITNINVRLTDTGKDKLDDINNKRNSPVPDVAGTPAPKFSFLDGISGLSNDPIDPNAPTTTATGPSVPQVPASGNGSGSTSGSTGSGNGTVDVEVESESDEPVDLNNIPDYGDTVDAEDHVEEWQDNSAEPKKFTEEMFNSILKNKPVSGDDVAPTEGSGSEPATVDPHREERFKAQQDATKGKIKSCDFHGDLVPVDTLVTEVQDLLTKAGITDDEVHFFEYPFASQVGGNYIVPFDGYGIDDEANSAIIGNHNMNIVSSISIGRTNASIVKRLHDTDDGYVIYLIHWNDEPTVHVVKFR